ncbi:helix-turn-helix transcriptional regulator [Flavimobilis sp. GY10621]|uniref:Helix-turn-helix transcriptional regulator n=1 Tax=Flavimobilis rhizosphaerae TaxID=2775421 RepID=A0ABR9DQQ5_9MICO|nr:helix-turn-helix transcriptional regulator [Flavimobilis rhizosphaerae]MBD9699254.1 helix-turn-helix transcriptional regulator [Flavimobilis rhizosphaerae]
MARPLPDEPADDGLVVRCRLDDLLDARGMTLQELAARTGITRANLSVLKNDRARAIRFSTLVALCDALACDVGDLLVVEPDGTA